MWGVELISKENNVIGLSRFGVVTGEEVESANNAIIVERSKLRSSGFSVLVNTAELKVFDKLAQDKLPSHQKMLLSLGMKRAVVVTGVLDSTINVQLNRSADKSGNNVETRVETIKEGCFILGIPVYDFNDMKLKGVSGSSDSSGLRIMEIKSKLEAIDMITKEVADEGALYANNLEVISSEITELNENAKLLVSVNLFVSEVATQTNLLGLNAAIEAARVGDLGRGFGVVAEEIRRLSIEVKNSSKKITDSISGISSRVEQIQRSINDSREIGNKQSSQLQELSLSVSSVSSAVNDALSGDVMNSIMKLQTIKSSK